MDVYSGPYLKNGDLTNERDVYQHESKNENCIWWHIKHHWWIGKCDDIGQNRGHAYLNPYKSCPNEGKSSGDWRRGGSDIGTQGYLWHSGKMFQ